MHSIRSILLAILLVSVSAARAMGEEAASDPAALAPAQDASSREERTLHLGGERQPLADGGEFLKQLTVNEPLYFLFGWRRDIGWDSKFQLSFKYRFFDRVYFGYTQTSVWDLSKESAPFYDSNYRPSLYYYYHDDRKELKNGYLFRLATGFEHESNGRDGSASRSVNTLFAKPAFHFADREGTFLARVVPKVLVFLEKSDNKDIAHYRGYGDLLLVFDFIKGYGFLNGVQVSADLRKGNRSNYGSVQVDLSWPLGKLTYVQLQYFGGWGETMLDYNRRSPGRLRLGIQVVRW